MAFSKRSLFGFPLVFWGFGEAEAQPTGTNTNSLYAGSPAGGDLSGTFPNPTVVNSSGVAIGPYGTAVLGQLPGSVNADNASAGNIGQYISVSISSTAQVSLSNAAATTIASAVLTPGDWDVWGVVIFTPSVTTHFTQADVAVSLISAALPLLNAGGVNQGLISSTALIGGNPFIVDSTLARMSIASTASQTAYLLADMAFSINTATAYGLLQARRVR